MLYKKDKAEYHMLDAFLPKAGIMQRCIALFVGGIQSGLRTQQQIHHFQMALVTRHLEGGFPANLHVHGLRKIGDDLLHDPVMTLSCLLHQTVGAHLSVDLTFLKTGDNLVEVGF